MPNHFDGLVTELESVSPQQRPERLISGIAKQMQASGNPQTQQLGQELDQSKSQLIQACQQKQQA